MNRKDLLKEMSETIGTKSPIIFFSKMVDVFNLLFNRIDDLEHQLKRVQINTVMTMHWEEKVALNMIADEIEFLRKAGAQSNEINIYQSEIDELKHVFKHGITIYGNGALLDYTVFCQFWQELLGYHPFLEGRK
jgi:hypothetical protein